MTAQVSQIFAYEIQGDSAVILRCFSRDGKAEIPDALDGVPVRGLAPYAFSEHMDGDILEQYRHAGRLRMHVPELFAEAAEDFPPLCGARLKEIVISPSVRHVGRYCFYNCAGLKRLEFSGALQDWGSGVFTGCHHIQELCIHAEQNGSSGLKQVLDELREELCVDYFWEDQQAHLMFPEFYEEGVENTPARIIESHVHGSGILYRNCFQGKKFDFALYDAMYPYAQAQESEQLLRALAVGRLRYPLGLEPRAREQYEAYVADHLQEIGRHFLDMQDEAGVLWLLNLCERRMASAGSGALCATLDGCTDQQAAAQNGSGEESKNRMRAQMCRLLDGLSEYAARLGNARTQSILIEHRRSYAPRNAGRHRLEL